MSNIAIITARGGSKRIPKKNIKDFCGKPIISYSIEAAINSNIFDEVMVSTDDEEIANISKLYGAKVPFYRSAETSNDFATTRDVLIEVLTKYKEQGIQFDYLCCIYPTAPFVTSEKIKQGYEILSNADADRLEPVVKYECPPQWASRINDKGLLEYCFPEYISERSQDLEPLYFDAGQFYWYNIQRCFFSGVHDMKVCSMILPETEVQDIDYESDWKLAEIKYQIMKG